MSDPKPTSALALLGVAYTRARSWLSGLSRPARVMFASTAALTVLFGALVALKVANPTYAVLFSQLEREDAASLVAKLKELKAPYRISSDGTAIEVPESQVHELRLELAGAGLPRGGGVGFESFDKMRLGATDFEQRVLYRRALEGELSRTIGTLGAVQSARVHLVLPERSVFVAHAEPASASLVLKLRAGRTLGGSEVAGIVHLTAASVPGLTPERVALVTTEGAMLHRPRPVSTNGESPGDDGESASEAGLIEASLEERARGMLEKVVGLGHADVRVTADLDLARVERVEDRYDPLHSSLRSEEVTIDRTRAGVDEGVAGVPGAESNLPGGPLLAGDAGAPRADAGVKDAPVHEARTRNYELDHVTEKRVSTRGRLRRLAVAVVLDSVIKTEGGKVTSTPRTKEEVDRIALLVRSAVGASDERGDVITVDSIPFLDAEAAVEPAPPPPPSLLERIERIDWRSRPVKLGGGALGGVVLLLLALRLLRRKKQRPALDVTVPTLPSGPSLRELEAKLEAPADVREAALRRASTDPATAALVIRHWLGTSEPGTTPPSAP